MKGLSCYLADDPADGRCQLFKRDLEMEPEFRYHVCMSKHKKAAQTIIWFLGNEFLSLSNDRDHHVGAMVAERQEVVDQGPKIRCKV